MPKRTKKTYTPEQKAALVAEVQQRYNVGGRTYKAVTDELGISESNYFAWAKSYTANGTELNPAPLVAVSTVTKKPRPPRPYPPAERQRLVAAVEGFLAQGLGIEAACKAAGVSDSTFRKWRIAAVPPPAMRPVEITALVPARPVASVGCEASLRLVTPGGYRVEGLSVAAAAELLRVLG